jgi:hypothetical protein
MEPRRRERLFIRRVKLGRGRVEPILRASGRAVVRGSMFEAFWGRWRARGVRIDAARWSIELLRMNEEP